MVEQTRQPSRVVSLQAGPGEVDTDTLFDMNLRYRTGPSPHSSHNNIQLRQTVLQAADDVGPVVLKDDKSLCLVSSLGSMTGLHGPLGASWL